MSAISTLVCGHDQCKGTAKVALDQLASSIERFAEKGVGFLTADASDDMYRFGPFCARVLLENSCAAVVGRLDSFRLLYLSEFQNQPEYEMGRRAKSAFAWSGDVLPDDKAAPTLWSVDYDIPKISRALFSKHMEHIYWRPAIDALLDFVSSQPVDVALAEIRALDAEYFIGQTKGRAVQLYSTLSKGVHWEFFTSALMLDEATIKTAIRDTCLLVAQLSLVSHFVPTAYGSLSAEVALQNYISFRRLIP